MLVVIPFVINALLNFVLGLLVALVLGPEEFGLYAIGAALMVFVNAAAIDWLKLAAIRFYSGSGSAETKAIKLSLDTLIGGISIALSGLLLAAVVLGVDFRLPVTLVAVAVASGICAGLFDYTGAIARAQVRDRAYARLILVKNLLALVLMVGGAWLTQNAAVVLLGNGLSVIGALMTIRHQIERNPLKPQALKLEHVRRFATYALPLVGANVLMATIPLVNRSLMASQHGLAEAGYFALASDMGIKLFGALGSALEILLLRAVVKADEAQGRDAAHQLIARNQIIVLAIALPIAAGLFAVLPVFESLFIPAAYRGHFAAYFVILLPAFLALTVTQAAFNPVFMIAHKTIVAIIAAAAGVAANGLVLWFMPLTAPQTYAFGMLAAFLFILAVTALASLRESRARFPLRDFLCVLIALGLMLFVIWPLRTVLSPWPALLAMISLGGTVYVVAILTLNVAGTRQLALEWFRRSDRRATD